MKPLPTQVWYPAKVLPWSALTTMNNGRELPTQGPEACYGFTPMYESQEACRSAFPDDVILSFLLEPKIVEPKKRKKRKTRKGAK